MKNVFVEITVESVFWGLHCELQKMYGSVQVFSISKQDSLTIKRTLSSNSEGEGYYASFIVPAEYFTEPGRKCRIVTEYVDGEE